MIATLAPMITPDPNQVDIASRLRPPDQLHRLGTDDLGRDVLSRVIRGPLFTAARFRAIAALNFRAYDYLLEQPCRLPAGARPEKQ